MSATRPPAGRPAARGATGAAPLPELASYLEDAPWPATKDELIDFAMRTGAPLEVVENLQAIEDDEEIFESIEEIWPDYPSKEDFFFNEDEY